MQNRTGTGGYTYSGRQYEMERKIGGVRGAILVSGLSGTDLVLVSVLVAPLTSHPVRSRAVLQVHHRVPYKSSEGD